MHAVDQQRDKVVVLVSAWLIGLIMYLGHTPVGTSRVGGLQARDFIPHIMIILAIIPFIEAHLSKSRTCHKRTKARPGDIKSATDLCFFRCDIPCRLGGFSPTARDGPRISILLAKVSLCGS
jgi:uncharacterized membrane protein